MLIFLLFGVLCMLGRTEGQNCTFPCNWINRDFRVTNGVTALGFWNFTETTFLLFGITSYECFKIVGRFLIVRRQNPDAVMCFPIEIHNADSFTTLYPEIARLEFTDECSICSRPSTELLLLSAVDTVAPNQTGLECNVPVGCIPNPYARDPIICVDNGNIEGDCNEATTPPPPPPTTPPPPPPTTPPPPPPPTRCKHRHQ